MQRYFVTTALLLCSLVILVPCRAQTEIESFKQTFSKIQQAYKGQESLSFAVRYLYSTVQQPADYLDSVVGRFQLSRGNSWGVLGEAEYIVNSDYKITLYSRTGAMMLDKRDDEETLAFFQLDSFFAQKEAFTITSTAPGRVQVRFHDNPLVYAAELLFDPQTYLLKKISYRLKAELAASEEQVGEESLVQILFSDYSSEPIDATVFSTEKYIQKKGKEYLTAPAYAGYSIYLASSKLLN